LSNEGFICGILCYFVVNLPPLLDDYNYGGGDVLYLFVHEIGIGHFMAGGIRELLTYPQDKGKLL